MGIRSLQRAPLMGLLCCALFPASGAGAEAMQADSATEVWLNPGIYSRHFDRGRNFREDNVGFGVEVLLGADHGLMAGSFINSDRERSRYGAYRWRPLHWQVAGTRVSAGIAAGVFDGYPRYHNGGAFAAALPMLSVEGERFGANLAVIPAISNRLDGAIAIQVKLRAW